MASYLFELHIWSLKNQYSIPDYAVGCHVYHDKVEKVVNQEYPYHLDRQQYIKSREILWRPPNQRPCHVRDALKEVEEMLTQSDCLQVRWLSRLLLQLILSNGCIVSISLSGHCGDVENVVLDKSMIGKFSTGTVSHVVLTDQYLVACLTGRPRIDLLYFSKRLLDSKQSCDLTKQPSNSSQWFNESAKTIHLSLLEPKMIHMDFPGHMAPCCHRKISVSLHRDMLLLWNSTSGNKPWPWIPLNEKVEPPNIVVLSVAGPHVSVLTFVKTKCDLVFAEFSFVQPYKFFTIEQRVQGELDILIHICRWEIRNKTMQTFDMISIPLKATVMCQAINPTEDKLVLGCCDCSVVMYDRYRNVTQYARAAVIPSSLAWHPCGTIFLVGSVCGDVQVFDFALNSLTVQFVSEDPQPGGFLRISKLFRTPVCLKSMHWSQFDADDGTDVVFLAFERGPPALLVLHLGNVAFRRWSAVELTIDYIRHQRLDDAVNLLCAMNFDVDGAACYSCLSAIVQHLLRQDLTIDSEAQLERTLATFYAPKADIREVVIMEYRESISRLARRFFYHLLRYLRLDKAFLLAVDIGARDLFMTLHYVALDRGQMVLSDVARRKSEMADCVLRCA